ncbi:MAG: sulfotransferase domain-containing protein [Candidatus Marinarcus sp.]|uniref:sulfotransferase domain-containing protein n=1 Tax=Candidatus Marinarcus sp. TaxID=3100987 RepID=UPI003B008DE0
MNRIFITGMGRSGTTLLEKLLSNHEKIEILSQPFPLLFVEVKKAFLKSIGIEKYYVLNDNCFNGDYEIEKFRNFLFEYTINYDAIKKIFEEMKTYSGQMTKIEFKIPVREKYTFLELYDLIITNALLKNKVQYFGTKEIMCEEFLPFLSENNTKVIVIIRNPKDVVASVNYPKKEKYLGNKKPTLFILESWLKTIDYIKNFETNPNILYIKYEDLVKDTYNTLSTITQFLEINSFKINHFADGICDSNGELWKANTSFDTQTSFISFQSIGGYKHVLSESEIHYIETVCHKEMILMEYDFLTLPDTTIIKEFKDYNIEDSTHLDKNYSSLPINIEKQLVRYQKNSKDKI